MPPRPSAAAGRQGDVVVVGWDTAPDEIKAVEEGVVTARVAQNPFRTGYDGVNAAVSAIREGAKPKDGDTGVTLVTKDNPNDPKVQVVLKPSCKNPHTEASEGLIPREGAPSRPPAKAP